MYAVRLDIENIFGVFNVSKWADIDGQTHPVAIIARITEALTLITEEIDDILRGGPYTIPFTVVPSMIKRICATLAGIWLYEARGVTDTDANGQPLHKYVSMKQDAYSKLQAIRCGAIVLDGLPDDAIPEVVTEVISND